MAFGNRVGMALDEKAVAAIPLPPVFAGEDPLFAPLFGSLILEIAGTPPPAANWTVIGKTTADPAILSGSSRIPLDRAQMAWEKPLSRVFPPVSGILPDTSLPAWATAGARNAPAAAKQGSAAAPAGKSAARAVASATVTTARPLVVLPVFPGTNCEYDMARAFRLSGADTRMLVLRNRTKEDLAESLVELRKAIDSAHILAFSGGFSAGDEPDGSGKFIANIIRENEIADGIMELLETRKGLVLGICNGFQALIKVGLLPYGKILSPSEEMPTLTYNTVGRHISRFVRTRIVSDSSPWANGPGLLTGTIHRVPVSHGEGRIIMESGLAKELFASGQVFTQYVDDAGSPAMTEPDNPNGSMYAIEGMTCMSGLVLGKMGHSERTIDAGTDGVSRRLFKNIPGDTNQNIFAAGVRYWRG